MAPSPGDQFQAELSSSASGRLDLSFYDRSYSGNKVVDLTYASSRDGGKAWAPVRVTRSGFDPAAWGVPSGSGWRPFLGDYNGIASLATTAQLTWTGVSAPAPYNLDIFTATITP